MNFFKYTFFQVFILIFSQYTCAQDLKKSKTYLEYGLNGYYGALFKHRLDQEKIYFPGAFGVEANIQKFTDGRNNWERFYNYPKVGCAVMYFNYNMPDELGKAYSLIPYMDFTLSKKGKRRFRIKSGFGAVYSTKTHELITNEENSAISSKVSIAVTLDFQYDFKISDHFSINANAGFRHYSNGRLRAPNNGINYLIVGLGARYTPQPIPKENFYLGPPDKTYENKLYFNVMGATAWRHVRPLENGHHNAYIISVYASKMVGPLSNLVLGIDGFKYHTESMRQEYLNRMTSPEENNLDGRQAGITFGHELLFGKLAFVTQIGIYFYLPVKFDLPYYQRVGFRYYLCKNAFLNTTLKAYTSKADMLEFGLGFRL
ncbi:acyloxyacyl hydrolase [Flexithrix dorotheae]|uniref:acyloxyacyl hydrolase n=1 Tax=Flexithrix dorotheae TaxID=70993 RepID=UPI00036EB752|nr:acyloxyacyl hydrolase [Flexithrix dorotheae]